MNRRAEIYFFNKKVGLLTESEEGFAFSYDEAYVQSASPVPISMSLPVTAQPYHSMTLFSFFDGLIPEGWLLDLATESWKLNVRDRMGLLLACCRECIGAVSVLAIDDGVQR